MGSLLRLPHLPVSSRRMPVRRSAKRSRVATVASVLFLFSVTGGIAWWAFREMSSIGMIVVLILFAVLVGLAALKYRLGLKKRFAMRGEPSIDAFVRNLPIREMDPMVVRGVYEILARRCRPYQILPDDDLRKTFFTDDLELVEIVMEFEEWFSLDRRAMESVPDRIVRTPKDLILYCQDLVEASRKTVP